MRPLYYLDDPETLAIEKAAFVNAALELLQHSNSVDVRVQEIVRRCGGHNAAFYRIFGSKEGLLLAVVAEAVDRTATVLRRRMAAAAPSARVAAWVEVLMQRAGTTNATAATLPFALDRHRILHRFPEAEPLLTLPLREPLIETFREQRVPEAEMIAAAAFEMVMSRQATWIALEHRPSRQEVQSYVALVHRLAHAS
ncbi:MAG TPA: TetR family transcriptional regulator [Acidimicrobiales bacterium]